MLANLDLDACSVPRCKRESHIIIYIGQEQAALCVEHWVEHCEEVADLEPWRPGGPNGKIEQKISRRRS